MLLEIAVGDVEGARVARESRADRIELSQALPLGGLTPSPGQAELATALGVPVRALIRPRGGGFAYSAAEVAAMVRDIEALTDAGAAGFVLGALDAESAGLDRQTLRLLIRAAEGRAVLVHRCVDVLLAAGYDPAGLAGELADLGAAGVLTSGGAPRALEGVPVLSALAEGSEGRLEIVAGGGVRPEHVHALADAGAHAVHLSAATSARSGPAGPGGGTDEYMTTGPARVAAARAAVDELAVR